MGQKREQINRCKCEYCNFFEREINDASYELKQNGKTIRFICDFCKIDVEKQNKGNPAVTYEEMAK